MTLEYAVDLESHTGSISISETAVESGLHLRRKQLRSLLQSILIRQGIVMNKRVLKIFSVFLIFSNPAAHAVVMGGVVGWSYQWPVQTDGYNSLEAPIKIIKDGGRSTDGKGSHYYIAINWSFVKKSGGYIGLQNRNGEHWVNFSIWDVSEWSEENSEAGAECKTFGHEGSGVQCEMPYSWKEGETYTLEAKHTGDYKWEGSIVSSEGVRTIISKIHGDPEKKGFSSGFGGFIEEYSQGNEELLTCADSKPFSSTMYPVKLDSICSAKVDIWTYGDCSDRACAYCDKNAECYGSVNEKQSTECEKKRYHRPCSGGKLLSHPAGFTHHLHSKLDSSSKRN